MPKHLYSVILFTFIVGLATGVYVYFMTGERGSRSESVDNAPARAENGYEVLATAYGGCERIGCASYRLKDDGTYLYLAPDGVHSFARFEDTISPRQRERIGELLSSAPLSKLRETMYTGTCSVTYDGIAYRFDIKRGGESYTFDTCENDIEKDELFIELTKYFAIMEATHRTP